MERNGVILLVDDNSDDVWLTKRAFAKAQLAHEIVVAGDGQEALDLLLPDDPRPPLQPAVVLLDLNMPKVGGLEVLHRLRADPRTECQPVVILTTSQQDEERLRCYRDGANAFVRKPVDFAEFMRAAEALSLFWTSVNQCAPPLLPPEPSGS